MAPWADGIRHGCSCLHLSDEALPCRKLIILSYSGCLGGASQDPALPIIQVQNSIWCQRVRPERKAGVLVQERILSAAWDQAFPLALRTL
jgi:hypothetical protein